ncbi:MAG: metallophosphoesterase, partial [Saprospiraceae bacterium]
QEATKYGGRVHYILGNHEVMNLEYDFRYVHRKYLTLARQISGKNNPAEAFPYLMSENNVLVQWLRTRNCMEKIGSTLYVHGGVSAELVAAKMRIDEVNKRLRTYLEKMNDSLYVNDERSALIIGAMGPLWYRGLANRKTVEYEPAAPKVVNQALRYYKVKKMVIGHTLMPEVSTDYNGKVIKIDIIQPPQKRTGKAQALLMENGTPYRVNDLGERTALQH